MKKLLLFTLLAFYCCGSILAQENGTGKKGKKKQTTETATSQTNENDSIVLPAALENDEEEDDDSGGIQFVPSLLHSSRDVYTNNSSYAFSIAYFKARGYDNRYLDVLANGYDMSNLVTGNAVYSMWGGLNHIFRYPEVVSGLNEVPFDFGDIGGATNFNLRASNFRKQLRATYSLANRTYTNRMILTYSSGLTPKGWAFTASVSSRFGNNLAYVDGTPYTSFSGFLAAEKRLNHEHWLNLAAFANYQQRGMQSSSVQEAYDLLDNNYYNANWGWYQGKQRNARIRTVCEPVIMLTHNFTPGNNKLIVETTLATTFGFGNTTSLNWYDAQDPRPDYYRYLPSYQISEGDTSQAYYDVLALWQNNDQSYTQVNWDNLYAVNQLAAEQGKRAQYILENRRTDHYQIGGSTHLNWTINEHWKLYAGATIRGMKQHNYKTIADMLGGSFWLDVDKFSEGDFPEDQNVQYNDLLHKGDSLHEGDIFGYNYDFHVYEEKAWALAKASYNHWDFYAGLQVGSTQLWRYGHMQNGRYPDESLGKSEVKTYMDNGVRAGVTYKVNGRNYLILNGLVESKSPNILNSFLSPRIHNQYVNGLTYERIFSGDFSYVMNYPGIKMRITAFATKINDASRLISFYHDDFSSMVNYAISGIDKRYLGVEAGADIKLGSMFSLILAGTWGDFRYTDRAHVTMNAENGTDFDGTMERTVYWKNYHVAGSPQVAATAGLKFNYNYWFVNINANWFDKIYCELNPERRTSTARGSLDVNSELYHQIADQTRLKGQFTMDISVSKSWRIDHKYNIGFNASITNLLNNKNLVTTAWEQYRFDYTTYNVNKYPNKYYYAFGTTFYLGINFQM